MEQNSLTEDTPSARLLLEGQLRECYGRIVYSHKTHEKCADILLDKWTQIKRWQLILSALTACGFIAAVFGGGQIGSILGVVVSTVLLVLNAYIKDFDHSELAQKHKQTANNLWLVREQYLSLIADTRMGKRPIVILQDGRDALMRDSHAIYTTAPPSNSKGYTLAQTALKLREDLTFSDEEIDAFLPRELRKTGK